MSEKKLVTLFAVGDLMLGEEAVSHGHGVGSIIDKNGSRFTFEPCADILQQADILFGNMEVVVSAFNRKNDPFDQTFLRAQPIMIEGLKYAGFNILNLANNHIMQHGQKALDETLELFNKNNISTIGIEIPERGIKNFCVLEKNGFKIGFLGYCLRPLQYFLDPPVYATGEINKIRGDIERVRDRVNIMVVSLHWGNEFIPRPSDDQVKLGRKIIDSGANIILGHHPSILQGVEKYKGGVIAYSMGNFVSDMWQYRLRKSMILQCDISASGEITYDILPVIINLSWQPEVIKGKEGEILKQEIHDLSKLIGKSIADPDGYWVELKRNTKQFKREIHWHYLTNLYRFSSMRLFSNLSRIIRNRIARKGQE